MDAGALDKAVQEAKDKGQVPLAVVGTCGTTVLGAFDPLTEIARVCKKYGIWLHVDVSVCVCVCVCVSVSVCVCVCVGVVQKNKKEVKRWEAYVSVTCTWLPECLYTLGLPIAICKDSLVTYSVCTCV